MVIEEICFVGLGKMGGNMVSRILKKGDLSVLVSDHNPDAIQALVKKGAKGAVNVDELLLLCSSDKNGGRKVIWLMLPSGKITESVFQEFLSKLSSNDILIDGGNSNFKDTFRRHKEAKAKDIRMLDVGVSGGIVAADSGYPMMIGGHKDTYEFCKPLFESFGLDQGYDLVGGDGAGHYVKMIHNAIEYGMMQAISEGFDLLNGGRLKDLDLKKISHIWNHGTIVSSFLMQMVEQAMDKDASLGYLEPFIDDNGEGKWSAIEALEYGVPFVVNSYALNARYISRDNNSYSFRLTAAMRNEFGGHSIKKPINK